MTGNSIEDERVVRAKRCTQCDAINDISKIRCRACKNVFFEEIQSPPVGFILTFTNCNALPPRLTGHQSQGFAIVQLQEEWRVLGQLDDPGTCDVGDHVEGEWRQISINDDDSPAFGWVFHKTG